MHSLQFFVEDKRISLQAFVIMSNHSHIVWQMQPLIHPQHVQRDFLKYTAQKIKYDLKKNHPVVLSQSLSPRITIHTSSRRCQPSISNELKGCWWLLAGITNLSSYKKLYIFNNSDILTWHLTQLFHLFTFVFSSLLIIYPYI